MIYTRRMATLEQAYAFLARLRSEARPKARTELFELQLVARSQGADYKLDYSDVNYWRERLVEKRFSLSTEYLSEFFQLPNVLDGLFGLLRRLFGVEVVAADGDADIWDPHVRFFRVREADTGELIASFFLDLHRRRGKKKPGFWYAKIQDYSTVLGTERSGPRLPAAHIVCDLAPPDSSGKPTLLTHEDVRKLFHTMGGALRHLLCNQTEGLVAGSSGLELDAVAIPAFFLERWAYDPTTLRSMAQHVTTSEQLPEPAIDMIAATRSFHRALGLLKRTTLAQIDLDLHAQYDPDGELPVFDVVKLIEEEFAVIPPRIRDRELCSAPISGEFGGASLVADLWAEALAADVLTEFEAEGFDNERAVARLGRKLRRTLLAPGGGRSPVSALRDFLGRQPAFAAFMQHMGLQGQNIDHLKSQVEGEYDDASAEDDSYVEFEEEAEEEQRTVGSI
jgi:oligopeptidase A